MQTSSEGNHIFINYQQIAAIFIYICNLKSFWDSKNFILRGNKSVGTRILFQVYCRCGSSIRTVLPPNQMPLWGTAGPQSNQFFFVWRIYRRIHICSVPSKTFSTTYLVKWFPLYVIKTRLRVFRDKFSSPAYYLNLYANFTWKCVVLQVGID